MEFEKKVHAYCPSCVSEQDFTYINLENIQDNLVYWQCDCKQCGRINSGFINVGFEDI